MNPYLLVNGNFVSTNGMDMPNLALARFLANRDAEVHLAAYRVEEPLASHPRIVFHQVRKTANSDLLSAPALAREGRRWAETIATRNGSVVVNGGNCMWGDVNWVHFVHAAFQPVSGKGALRTVKDRYAHRAFLASEREALKQARIVIANSNRTRADIVERVGVPAERVHVVYYGIDPERYRPASPDERAKTRAVFEWPISKPMVAFVGALGDRRKGFDTLFAAWETLCRDRNWTADLVVVGAGAELEKWKKRAAGAGLQSRIRFLGFREDVPTILAACDALVSPTRYEAYGQAVHEALCCGLPAIVSKTAGVAERFTPGMRELWISDPEAVDELVERLWNWHDNIDRYRDAAHSLSQDLRLQTWDHMAGKIVELVESKKGSTLRNAGQGR